MAAPHGPPERGQLATLFEECAALRRRVVEKPATVMTRWTSTQAYGVASVKAMVLNTGALEAIATWWTSRMPYPKAVPIDLMRHEARFRTTYSDVCSSSL